jgi:protein CpxP
MHDRWRDGRRSRARTVGYLFKEYSMSQRTSRFLAVAAASLAFAAGAAHAAQNEPPPGGLGGPGGGGSSGHFMQQLNQLHGQLKLDAHQEQQWQDAVDTMKQTRETTRANHKQMHRQFQAMQQQPILDLNALHAAHQRIEQQDAQLREQSANAWLNFYNGLNDQQKTTVSTALKQHFAKMEARREKMHERWEQHRGGKPAPGSAPVSP